MNTPIGRSLKRAFTMVEILSALAIIAVLLATVIPMVGNYIQSARETASRQTLTVLNDALTRYKTQGGDITALTAAASIGNVLELLRTPTTWANGLKHQFLKSGDDIDVSLINAYGTGKQYRFTRYDNYIDSDSYTDDIVNTYSSYGVNPGDETAFRSWIESAMQQTESGCYLALVNPSSTTSFQIDVKTQSSGDKVMVWWGDGSTNTYTGSSSSDTALAKSYGSSANRSVLIVGNISSITSNYSDGRTAFAGDVSTMPTLTYISTWGGSHTLGGDVTGLKGLTYLNSWANNTFSGDISNLTDLTLVSLGGNGTVGGAVDNLTELTYLAIDSTNAIGGSVANLTNLTYLYAWGANSISGSISNLTELVTVSVGYSCGIGGSITNLNNLQTLVLWATFNTVTGSLDGKTQLRQLREDGNSNLTKPADWSTLTALSQVYVKNLTTSTMVDSLLVGMDASKGSSKPAGGYSIQCTSNCASPSSTGLTAKTNLQNAGWSVSTN